VWRRTLASVGSADPTDPHGTVPNNSWAFDSWAPDALVVNLGTNDNPAAHPEIVDAFNSTYLALLTDAAAAYPSAHFFLAFGPMSTSYEAEISWVRDAAAARGLGGRVHLLDQTGFACGCCGHPCAAADRQIGNASAAFIAATLGW